MDELDELELLLELLELLLELELELELLDELLLELLDELELLEDELEPLPQLPTGPPSPHWPSQVLMPIQLLPFSHPHPSF